MEHFYVIVELGRDQLSSSLISSLIGCHLRTIRGTDSSGKQFFDIEFIFYIFVNKYLDDRSGEQY
jgi:hypothetical protein